MQTIGERLEEARKKKGVSIREAAEATKIRGDYLQKFESNQFDIGLTEIYTRGFLRTYANFLKLPADRILADYASLGRSELRPRQPNREVYGRMDISVAHADSADRAASTSETPAAPEPSPANRGPHRPRSSSSLPTGPDPALVFKYLKWGGVTIIVILVLVVINAMFSGRGASGGGNTPKSSSTNAPRPPTVGLIALRPVTVMVTRKNADGSNGEELWKGTLQPGQTKTILRTGAIFIDANPPGNLEIDLNGNRTNWGQALLANGGAPGQGRGELPAPKTSN